MKACRHIDPLQITILSVQIDLQSHHLFYALTAENQELEDLMGTPPSKSTRVSDPNNMKLLWNVCGGSNGFTTLKGEATHTHLEPVR